VDNFAISNLVERCAILDGVGFSFEDSRGCSGGFSFGALCSFFDLGQGKHFHGAITLGPHDPDFLDPLYYLSVRTDVVP